MSESRGPVIAGPRFDSSTRSVRDSWRPTRTLPDRRGREVAAAPGVFSARHGRGPAQATRHAARADAERRRSSRPPTQTAMTTTMKPIIATPSAIGPPRVPISPGSYEGAPIVLTAQAQTRRLFARPRAVSGDLGTDSNVLFESCRLGQPRGLRRAEPALSYTGPEASNEVHADHDAP